jgi:hypothetical protein
MTDFAVFDGSHLTIKGEEGNLKDALNRRLNKSGGDITGSLKIEGDLKVSGKVARGNVCKEAMAENEISTSKRGYEDMPDMIIDVDTGDSFLFILAVISESVVSERNHAFYRLVVDNDQIGVARNHFVSRHSSVVIHRLFQVKSGKHTIKVQWYAQGGWAKSYSTRTLTVTEM